MAFFDGCSGASGEPRVSRENVREEDDVEKNCSVPLPQILLSQDGYI
jgi:hypothetical protein